MRESTGLQKKNEIQHQQPPDDFSYNDSYRFYLQRLTEARDQRTKQWKFFDDLTYEEDYELNQQAKNSYLRRKKNDDEVRINTGTTEKKIEAVEVELLNMNLQHEVIAFDNNDLEIQQLGQDIADIVKRTNEIEHDEDIWQEAIEELITQRALFMEEVFVDKEVEQKQRRERRIGKAKQTIFDNGTQHIKRAEKHVLNGLQVYLGDITIPAYRFNEQPYVVKYERMSYEEAALYYGHFDNWKYVKAGSPTADEYGLNYKWRFATLMTNEVEILYYYSYPDDEYQVIIQGVMMFEPGEPLPWEHEGYNITMTVLKPLSRDFAYGKPLTASAKTLQALDNETIRNLVRKFRQAIEPPIGVKGGKIYSKDIWSPAAITQGVSKDDFSRLIDHDGVTGSEFAMYDMITRKTEEFIGQSSALSGMKGQKRMTATQVTEIQKQAMKMLGLAVYAVMRVKRDMTYLRIFTILSEYTHPIGQEYDKVQNKTLDIYRKFTISNGVFENDQTGKKVVHFMDRSLSPEEEKQIYDYEKEQEAIGNPIRISTINVAKLKEVPVSWYVVVNSQEREGSALNKVMFNDQFQQASALSDRIGRPFNTDKWVENYERTWKFKDAFQVQAPQGQTGQPGQPAQPPGSEATALKPQPPTRPQFNQMAMP